MRKSSGVKYDIISQILVSHISQGSAESLLRYGGKYDMDFVANFTEYTTVK